MNILIAEDEPSLRENLRLLLSMEGYQVTATAHGRDALEHALRQAPDLVITDVMMPFLDGHGLVTALRENPATSTVPVIMLTAKADRGDVRAGMNCGADDYLTKPYRRDELLESVRARLARGAAQAKVAARLQATALAAQQIDGLTELPNRSLFEQELAHLLGFMARSPEPVYVLCLGLDGFAKVNESLGPQVGDAVLLELSRRLQSFASTGQATWRHAALARLGGDQFALRWVCGDEDQDLPLVCTQVLELVAQPYLIEGRPLYLTACVGLSHFPQQALSAQALLLNAESALHQAKPAGQGSYRIFDSTRNDQVLRRLELHNELHQALDKGELQVFYQPQVRIATQAVVGFEALLRWNHPVLGWVSPGEFIPIAEDSGLIVKIGEWVMRTAAAQARQWLDQGFGGFRMAVNLSVRQFSGCDLPTLVAAVLRDTRLPAEVLELEVTESLALHSVEATLATLHACKALGVKLAMDDFGTGYSSLAYLKRYPLDALKIDQAFVRNIPQDLGDMAITRAVVAMAHSFGMTVIAEGVETTTQLEFLRSLDCEDVQGYLFSKPVPAAQAELCFAGYRQPLRDVDSHPTSNTAQHSP